MTTGSLRTRVALVTLSLLTLVLALVVAAVTLAYRSSLERDLRNHLDAAGAAVMQAGSGSAAKPLVRGLALEGIATTIASARVPLPPGKAGPGRAAPIKPGESIRSEGSLLVLDETLSDGTRVTFSASSSGISHAVNRLLLVEVLVALGALALATLVVLQSTSTALRPLNQVINTATRIAAGDRSLRLRPSRTDTELGSMAAAFDRMVDTLAAAIRQAENSDAATRRFLADASHELRTPIAALQATAETLLREQPARPERDRIEAALARDAARLGRLVDDLLGLARLEAHSIFDSLSLNAVIRSAAADAASRAPNTKIDLDLVDDVTIEGDANNLTRLLRNLLDNALAAVSPAGNVRVSLHQTGDHIDTRISDDGPGIPAQEREHIFERFARLDPTTPGSGLGLAIARRIAHEHGGDLTCDPVPAGSSFTLHLPTGKHRPEALRTATVRRRPEN
jgi:two-component system, OmpR family, sensor kinase